MIKRSFIPGDEWLYYKIYCGSKTSDEILTNTILPLSKTLEGKGYIDYWFFIRYSDPDMHLRIRFHISQIKYVGQVMELINSGLKPYIDSDKVWNVMLDTYQRELERYNPKSILFSEYLFAADSLLTTSFIDLIEGNEGENIRWMFAFKSIDALLSDFEYNLSDKLKTLEIIKNRFAIEFGMNRILKKQLDKKYRIHSEGIKNIINLEQDKKSELFPILEIIGIRSVKNKAIAIELRNLECKENSFRIESVIPSYIHMIMNRLFKSKQRLHEMVVYDFLWRYYRSAIAMDKNSVQKSKRSKIPISI